MAANDAQPAFGPEEVLQAMLTMRGGAAEKRKKEAHEYLELFQKSVSIHNQAQSWMPILAHISTDHITVYSQQHGPRASRYYSRMPKQTSSYLQQRRSEERLVAHEITLRHGRLGRQRG